MIIATIVVIAVLVCLIVFFITDKKTDTKPTELKICSKCKHFQINHSKENICANPKCITYDLVTGVQKGHVCDLVRKYPSYHYTFPNCGSEGKWFEPKENEKTKEKETNNETL